MKPFLSTKHIVALIPLALVLALAACNGSSVGDACATPGSTDECGSDAVCDADTKLGTVCLELCKADSDCPSGDTCSGTTGSLKGCHPK